MVVRTGPKVTDQYDPDNHAIYDHINKKAPRSMSRWDVSDAFTAQTVAHEIGHNLGFYHDFDESTLTGRTKACGPGKNRNGLNNDLMNYAANDELKQNKWSDCTNEDFRNYFARVTSFPGATFCLEGEVDQQLNCLNSPLWEGATKI